MARLSIRLRLTAWYSAVLLAGMLLLSAMLWFAVRHNLLAALDYDLWQKAHGAVAIIQQETGEHSPEAVLRGELAEYAATVPEGYRVEVRGPGGSRLYPAQEPRPMGRHYRRAHIAATVAGQAYDVTIGASPRGIGEFERELGWILLWAIPATVILASLGGYWLSLRALGPVDAMTSEARSIGIGNLSRRLGVPSTGDELERLARTWNDMLERLEAAVRRLTQFTADASHELRTPVALIRTTAELGLRRERSPQDYRGALRQIMEESERTSRLVEDLLVLARADGGSAQFHLEPIDLVPLVREVCGQARLLSEAKHQRVSLDLSAVPAIVEGDAAALRRLVLILFDNSVKYTPEGGRIDVSIGANGSGPLLSVRDSGAGIAGHVLPHVFERFYRADQSRNRDAGAGTGLGLAIAKWIAERHGADIRAESVEGEGSTFRVQFPAMP